MEDTAQPCKKELLYKEKKALNKEAQASRGENGTEADRNGDIYRTKEGGWEKKRVCSQDRGSIMQLSTQQQQLHRLAYDRTVGSGGIGTFPGLNLTSAKVGLHFKLRRQVSI